MIELTEEQLKHFESIKWLIGGPLACGKSTVLAMAFIDYAMKNPGQRVLLFDHEKLYGPYDNRNMLNCVENLVPNKKDFTFRLTDYSFEYKKPAVNETVVKALEEKVFDKDYHNPNGGNPMNPKEGQDE